MADTYVVATQAYMHAHGGFGFIIRSHDPDKRSSNPAEKPTPAQWKVWLEYFETIGVKAVRMRKSGMGTVPSEWPESFDATAPSSDPGWAPSAYSQVKTKNYSAEIAGLFRKLVNGIDGHVKSPPKFTQAEALAQQLDRDARLRAPIAPSARLAASMGITQAEIEQADFR